jgi:hypothetical protein
VPIKKEATNMRWRTTAQDHASRSVAIKREPADLFREPPSFEDITTRQTIVKQEPATEQLIQPKARPIVRQGSPEREIFQVSQKTWSKSILSSEGLSTNQREQTPTLFAHLDRLTTIPETPQVISLAYNWNSC